MRGPLLRLLATAVAGLVVLMPAAAEGALDGRLQGRYTIQVYGAGASGDRFGMRFTPKCKSGPCEKVVLRREVPTGQYFKSTLHRTRAGQYKGRERNKKVGTCANGGAVRQTAKLHIRVTAASKNGHATRFSGQVKFRAKAPCAFAGNDKAYFYGSED